MNLIDLHCHILPYVDDGAASMEEALELLETEHQEGVTELCLTPHLRSGMFGTPDEKIWEVFGRLKQAAGKIPIALHLSREYFFDAQFCELLNAEQVIPMGRNSLLVEFPYRCSFTMLEDAAQRVKASGLTPVFAHVERYAPIVDDPDNAARLLDLGVQTQINSNGILGTDSRLEKKICQILLKKNYVSLIGSDTHEPYRRVPNLEKCRKLLEKKYGGDCVQKLMYTNPLSILR